MLQHAHMDTHTHMHAQAPRLHLEAIQGWKMLPKRVTGSGTHECLGTGGSQGNYLAAATRGRQEMMKSHLKLDFRNNLLPFFLSPKHTLPEQAINPRHTGTTQQCSQTSNFHGSGIIPPSISCPHCSLPPCTPGTANSWGKASLYFRACVGAGCPGSTQKAVVAGVRECGPVLGGTWSLDHRARTLGQTCCW